MKAITLVCAVALMLSVAFGIYNLSQTLSLYHLRPVQYVSQGVWIVAECSMAAFFFTLFSRQK